MALKTKKTVKSGLKAKRKFLTVTTIGVICLIIPIILIVLDPMFIIGKYNFRLANGTVLHEIFSQELECGRFEVYLFNITNAERFFSGKDYKLKLNEVGPFTYIEYRTHKDLLLKDGLMTYAPQFRSVFVPEKSVANPEDVNVTMPNIPMLSATTLVSSSPFLVQTLFNVMVTQFKSKPVVNRSVQDYLWGYRDPLLNVANKLVPGLVYFQTTGIMDRMYDKNSYYHLELGATDKDKFSIKKVKGFRVITSGGQETITESTATFNNTFEGIAYPPKMDAQTLNIYRVGICRSFPLTVCGKTTSEYGPDALVYEMNIKSFGNQTLCNSKGYCPKGLMDMSPCYFGLPLAMSKGHFLDGDEGIFDRIEGLKPNRTEHDSHLIVEPKIGLTLETKLSIQVSLVLGNLNYNKDARPLSDVVLPIAHFKIRQPDLPKIAVTALRLMYITMPKVLMVTEILLCIIGLILLSYSVKILRTKESKEDTLGPTFNCASKVDYPLIAK